jgi:hypothetical protein
MLPRLDVDLLLQRTGWLPWIAAIAVLAALAVELLGTAGQRALAERYAREAAALPARPNPAAAAATQTQASSEERLESFRGTLCEQAELHLVLARLFSEADKHGITLAQAHYKLDADAAGGYQTYQLTLPVQGGYRELRRFIDGALSSIHCAALEDIAFKREATASPATEAKLRLALFLKGSEP